MHKKFTSLCASMLLFALSLFAQQKQPADLQKLEQLNITDQSFPHRQAPQPSEKCGFAYMMGEAKANGFDDSRYEAELRRLITARRQMNNFGAPTTIYTLPVIFHISYDGNTEATPGTGANVSQLRINAQIAQLNKDFANLSGSIYGVAEDMGVRFVAAKVDPAGNLMCEPGIERINWRSRSGWLDPTTISTLTGVSNHYRTIVKPQSIWNPYEYLNIWVGNFDESGLLGVATFPGQSTLGGLDNSETDLTAGVVVLSGTVGSAAVPGTQIPYHLGKTLSHEMGHFFGLRHITGDANCGEDYCDDTPPQDDLTGGCPAAGTLNNCSPSVPKMFENYMDYTNDACLNTFTLNQSERCQVVMLNSPRRKELTTSTKGTSPLPNRLSFKSAVGSISESATGVCPRFKDYVITVGVDVAATGNATISVVRSGTATETADYIIFPSTASYTNGDATDKTFTLRVYDDAIVEGNETVVLSLSIVGGGVQFAPSCPAQLTVTLTDNDNLLTINNSNPVQTLFSEDFGTVTGSNQVPPAWTVSSTSSVNQWVGNDADAATYGFIGNTLHISNGNNGAVNAGTAPINYSLSSTTDARAFTPAINAAGLKNISVSLKVVSNGESDIDDVYDYGLIYYSLDGTNFTVARQLNTNAILQGIETIRPVTFYLPSTAVGTNTLRFLFRWISDNNVGAQPPFAIDEVVVSGTATTVETQLNNSSTEPVPPGAPATYFYSTSDAQIIARVQNSTEDAGCLTANIQSPGSTITSLTTSNGTFFRSEKIISLIPAVANTTAGYQATFYFTTAELASWGIDVPNLKLMKVRTGVNLGGTITAADAQVVPAVIDDQRALKGYASFTGNFTGGFAFSQHMLVSPLAAVPVTLVRFEAKPAGKNIVLTWTTSFEANNKGFVVERGTNAIDFEKIGWVDGKGNSSVSTNYLFADNFVQPGIVYYYRLRQSDLDGRESLSEIRQAKIQGHDIFVSVTPNPSKDYLKLFTSGYTGNTDIKLLTATGQLIRSWTNMNTSSAPKLLNIQNTAAGVYLLQLKTSQGVISQRIIIQ